MIRVTCADGVIRYDLARAFYGYWYCYNIQLNKRVMYSAENVYKIEKQVKNLGTEELNKFVKKDYIFDDFTIVVKADSVILFGLNTQEKIVLMFDDYVDVTTLYKEDE